MPDLLCYMWSVRLLVKPAEREMRRCRGRRLPVVQYGGGEAGLQSTNWLRRLQQCWWDAVCSVGLPAAPPAALTPPSLISAVAL